MLGLALIVDVRRADESEFALVGNREHDAAVAVLEDVGKAVREQLRNHDVAAFDEPHPVAGLHR